MIREPQSRERAEPGASNKAGSEPGASESLKAGREREAKTGPKAQSPRETHTAQNSNKRGNKCRQCDIWKAQTETTPHWSHTRRFTPLKEDTQLHKNQARRQEQARWTQYHSRATQHPSRISSWRVFEGGCELIANHRPFKHAACGNHPTHIHAL